MSTIPLPDLLTDSIVTLRLHLDVPAIDAERELVFADAWTMPALRRPRREHSAQALEGFNSRDAPPSVTAAVATSQPLGMIPDHRATAALHVVGRQVAAKPASRARAIASGRVET
jgi:hypothetical protein